MTVECGVQRVLFEIGQDHTVHSDGRPGCNPEGIGTKACIVVREVRTDLLGIEAPVQKPNSTLGRLLFKPLEGIFASFSVKPFHHRGVVFRVDRNLEGGRKRGGKKEPKHRQKQQT
jgi:hypothetical protein